jgi:rod shape-determining protein MreD
VQRLFFPFLLLAILFFCLVAEHFLPPVPNIGARILLVPLVLFYGAVALPSWGMLMLAFAAGLMWDLLHVNYVGPDVEVTPGWSIILYAVLGAIMSGFRPWFQRGRWEVHCILCGLLTGIIPLAEYLMISIRRLPVAIRFDEHIWWRIGGSGIAALFLAPFFFFILNYFALLMGYDTGPEPEEQGAEMI